MSFRLCLGEFALVIENGLYDCADLTPSMFKLFSGTTNRSLDAFSLAQGFNAKTMFCTDVGIMYPRSVVILGYMNLLSHVTNLGKKKKWCLFLVSVYFLRRLLDVRTFLPHALAALVKARLQATLPLTCLPFSAFFIQD